MAYDFLQALNQAMGIQTATAANPVTYSGPASPLIPTQQAAQAVTAPTTPQYIQGNDGKTYKYSDYVTVYGADNVNKALAANQLKGTNTLTGQVQNYAPGTLKSFYDAPASSLMPKGNANITQNSLNGVQGTWDKYGNFTPSKSPLTPKSNALTQTPDYSALLPAVQQPQTPQINMGYVLSNEQMLNQLKALLPQAPSLQNYQVQSFDATPKFSVTGQGTGIKSTPTLAARQRFEQEEQLKAAAAEAANKAMLDQYGSQVTSATNLIENFMNNARAQQVAQQQAQAEAAKLAQQDEQDKLQYAFKMWQETDWNNLTADQQALLSKAGLKPNSNSGTYQSTQSRIADTAADNKLAQQKAAAAAGKSNQKTASTELYSQLERRILDAQNPETAYQWLKSTAEYSKLTEKQKSDLAKAKNSRTKQAGSSNVDYIVNGIKNSN